MSDLLTLVGAALAAVAQPDDGIARNDIAVAIPALDGLHGVAVSYERWLPDRKLSLAASAQLRESATGDYLGLHTGVGAELRWYWRADREAWLSRQPAGSMAGWFLGGRIDLGIAATRDRIAERWLPSAFELGATAFVGYRIAPWRDFEITPSIGLGRRREFSTSAPTWDRPTLSIGLSAGLLF